MTRSRLRWGNFDMAAFRRLKNGMLAEPSDVYVNGKRYDEPLDWGMRDVLEGVEERRERVRQHNKWIETLEG